MKVTNEITKLENSAVKLTVTIGKKDVATEYNTSVAKYAKNLQIPGFRKGKVPVSVLERKYGDALKADAAAELIEKALGEVFETIDEKPLPYTQPSMEEVPVLDVTKDLTFSVTYDIFPTVKIESLDGITIKEPVVEVGEAELKQEFKFPASYFLPLSIQITTSLTLLIQPKHIKPNTAALPREIFLNLYK